MAHRGHVWARPMPPLRACGARPSAGWMLRGETALGEKGPKIGEGRFSRRGAVSAPGRYGRTNGKALRCHRCLYEKPAAKKGQCWGQRDASLAGVRSPPLRGVKAPRRDGLAGRGSGIGDFLGGTHSVRSFGTAERMPRHFFPTTCVEDCPGAYRPHVSVKRKPTLRACRARPFAGGKPG